MPLLWLSLAYLLGLGVGPLLPAALAPAWPWMFLAALAGWPLLRRIATNQPPLNWLRWMARREMHLRLPPLLLLAAFAGGTWQVHAALLNPHTGEIATINDQGLYRITGVISAPPDRREQTTLVRLTVESAARIQPDGAMAAVQPLSGSLLALLRGQVAWQYGDRLALEGRPATPPENEDFSYRDALARQGIYSHLSYPQTQRLASNAGNPLLAAIYGLRDRAYTEIYRLFPAPEAPLLAGILLGIETDLTDDFQQAFRDTGTAHIIAISGFNIALLAGLFSNLFRRVIPRGWAALLAAFILALYTLLVGTQASVVRAAIMGSLGLLGALIGRRSSGLAGLNMLAFTAALMCLPNPLLLQDAGFQLSFAATLGLMLYADPLQSGFQRLAEKRIGVPTARRLAGPVGEYLLFTLAAQVVTLPVIAYHFQRLSLSALLANPLVLPAQPPLMILSGLAVLTGMVFEPLGRLLAAAAWPFSAYTLRVVEGLGRMSGGSAGLGMVNGPTALLLALVVLSPFLYSFTSDRLRQGLRAQARPALFLIISAIAGLLALRGYATRADGRLHLSLLNLDGNAGALFQSPDGARLLFGSGPGSNTLTTALGRRLPFNHHLDAVVLSDCSVAALESLPTLLERVSTGAAWWACPPPDNSAGKRLTQAMAQQALPDELLDVGRVLETGGARLQVLAARPASAALGLAWKDLRMLIPKGLSPGGLGAKAVQPGLLVLDESDLKTAPPAEWENLQAQVVILCANAQPHAGLPEHWVTLKPGGWAEIVSDGQTMWIEITP